MACIIIPSKGYQELSESIDKKDSTSVIHEVPDNKKSQWTHIRNLDSFFSKIYFYHQNHGLSCILLEKILEYIQYLCIILMTILLTYGINFPILFETNFPNEPSNSTSIDHYSIFDAIFPFGETYSKIGFTTKIAIVMVIFYWLFRIILYLLFFFDIKLFYNTALKIEDHELDNMTWHQIQERILEVQKENQIDVTNREITELDIHHRILRYDNYLVAMINQFLLPVDLKFPLIGDVIFLSCGLKFNYEFLLFWGPWSPFQCSWYLKDDYKKLNKRQELRRYLAKVILLQGLVNLLLSPLILCWQIFYFFCNYGELIKREPGVLATRTWSPYARLYLRHFNELDHELNSRLNRAFAPAVKYMSMFTSPRTIILAKFVLFIAGGIFAVTTGLTVYSEYFFHTANPILVIWAATAGCVATICYKLLPDENMVFCPGSCMKAVLAHTHYGPSNWKNQAHTDHTRNQFSQLFQFKAACILQELFSPLVVPYILIFRLRPRAMEIVDFYRNFTIEVKGLGDVCSFAEMDVRRHGNPSWQSFLPDDNLDAPDPEFQAVNGKTELSLVHFAHTNPKCKLPRESSIFLKSLQDRAVQEAMRLHFQGPLQASLHSMASLGSAYRAAAGDLIQSTTMKSVTADPPKDNHLRNVSRSDVPMYVSSELGLLQGLQQARHHLRGSRQDLLIEMTENNIADMTLSTVYLRELHDKQAQRRGFDEVRDRSLYRGNSRHPEEERVNLLNPVGSIQGRNQNFREPKFYVLGDNQL